MISQDFFDEVCLENAELLELDGDAAVQETLQQLGADQCAHLVQSFPSDACPERRTRREFVRRLERVEAVTSEFSAGMTSIQNQFLNNDLDQQHLLDDLKDIQRSLSEDYALYSCLLDEHNGVTRLLQLLLALPDSPSSSRSLRVSTQTTLLSALQKPSSRSLQQLQEESIQLRLIQWVKSRWGVIVKRRQDLPDSQNEIDADERIDLLYLIYYSCKANQRVKHYWMKDAMAPKLAALLVETIRCDRHQQLIQAACKLISQLCTFEESSSDKTVPDPTVATAHTHVQSLYGAGVVDALRALLQDAEYNNEAITSILQAIRSIAVQNDLVKALAANGTLQQVVTLFEESVRSMELELGPETEKTSQLDEWTFRGACIGFFRNVCANDDIKFNLCAGSMSVIAPIISCMTGFPAYAAMQEHALGAFAAMALRQPQNISVLLDAQVLPHIVQTMQNFPHRASLQRQGCLAIRNMASRADVVQKQEMLDLTENVLKTVAAKHLQCQDEVYAALRDMGIHQAHLFAVQSEETGEVTLQERQTFGHGLNANFRAVYD